jgi:hypothetical protein
MRSERLPSQAIEEMRKWIFANSRNPFPTYDQKKTWMTRFDLTMEKVNNFMANNRARLLGRRKDRIPVDTQVTPGPFHCFPFWIPFQTAPVAPQFTI